jgi:hypothetical protein
MLRRLAKIDNSAFVGSVVFGDPAMNLAEQDVSIATASATNNLRIRRNLRIPQ